MKKKAIKSTKPATILKFKSDTSMSDMHDTSASASNKKHSPSKQGEPVNKNLVQEN